MTHRSSPSLLTFPTAFALAVAAGSGTAWADEIIIPNHAPTNAGSGGYSTLLHVEARSYQLVVGTQELGGLPAGSLLTGITWRLPSWIAYPSWPATGNSCAFGNYDIYFSSSNNPVGSLSTTYTDNLGPDLTLVRSGAMTFQAGHFPGGAVSPQVNDFGLYLGFSTPYVYQGGELLLTLHHDGSSCSSMYLDTLSSPNAQAIGVSSYTQTTGWYNQGLITMKLEFQPGTLGTNYCSSTPNSTGFAAAMSGAGTIANATLSAGPVPNQPGIFYYGNAQVQLSFGNGLRCVGGTVTRLPVLAASGNLASIGGLDLSGVPTPFYLQYWFRDPAGGGSAFDLSDGYSIP